MFQAIDDQFRSAGKGNMSYIFIVLLYYIAILWLKPVHGDQKKQMSVFEYCMEEILKPKYTSETEIEFYKTSFDESVDRRSPLECMAGIANRKEINDVSNNSQLQSIKSYQLEICTFLQWVFLLLLQHPEPKFALHQKIRHCSPLSLDDQHWTNFRRSKIDVDNGADFPSNFF
uniref:Uncharacterized protein n=1 Tax=Romanomermis culicivorax TaxID=13658 RepID=A0A915KJN3_ROMCU